MNQETSQSQQGRLIRAKLNTLVRGRNPRKFFDPLHIEQLSNSIDEKDILQSPLVRPMDDGQFEIVIGECRIRAARLSKRYAAGDAEITVLCREMTDEEVDAIALIELPLIL